MPKRGRIPYSVYLEFKVKFKFCPHCGKEFAKRNGNGEINLQYLFDRMEIHHIKRVKNGGTNNLNNLIALCGACHYEEHKDEFSKPKFFMTRLDSLNKKREIVEHGRLRS